MKATYNHDRVHKSKKKHKSIPTSLPDDPLLLLPSPYHIFMMKLHTHQNNIDMIKNMMISKKNVYNFKIVLRS